MTNSSSHGPVRKIIIPQQEKTYSSFPNFTEFNDKIFIFYRQALTADKQSHGVQGRIKCFEIEKRLFLSAFNDIETENLYPLGHDVVIFENEDGNIDENEALVSKIDENFFSLATRTYDTENKQMRTYLSIADKPVFKRRHEVRVKELKWFIFYGKAFKWMDRYVFPAYGEFKEKNVECPIILSTKDFSDFEILSFLDSDIIGAVLNESSIVYDRKKHVIFMRDDLPPFGIWYSISDDLQNWETPELLFFAAHAPKALFFNNEILLAYRDLLSKTKTGITLLNLPSYKATSIETWEGNPYDGGYMDIMKIDNDIFIVYYIGNMAGEPFIKCCKL